ncbi:MAG: hypothetical protein ACPHW3_09650, partial [Candidatus Puniceispirillales bacterium]
MLRIASVISVIGFMLFIWFEPNVQDAPLLPPKMLEHSELTEADTSMEKDKREETLSDTSDQMQDSITFVDFPDDVTPTEITETASSSSTPQQLSDMAMPSALTPLTAQISDPEEQPEQPELTPLPPLPASAPIPASISASVPNSIPLPVNTLTPLPSVHEEQESQQVMMMIEPLTPIAPSPKPENAAIETSLAASPPVIVADMQSHQKAMQHLEQRDQMLDLELFWPNNTNDYTNIARILRQCFGMTAGYLTPDHELYLVRNQSVKQANRQ